MWVDPALAALPFRVGRAVGLGGAGEVFEAWTAEGRRVALKVAHRHDELTATLAEREVAIVRALPTGPFPTVLASGRLDDGRPWLALEWIDGGTLADRLTDARWSVPVVARLGATLARGLAAAHARGIVHRDLKPANVMFRSDGRAVIVDLGLARHHLDPGASATRCAGTPQSMAPEQVLGDDIGPATDLYALGVLLYRLYAGRDPFEGGALEMQLAHLGQPPAPLPADDAPGATALIALIGELLRKRPSERPASARAVATRLDALARPRWRRPAAFGAATIAAVAVAAMMTAAPPRAALARGGAVAIAPVPTAPVLALPPLPAPTPEQPWVVADAGDYTLRARWSKDATAGGALAIAVEVWDVDGRALPLASLAGALRDPAGRSIGVAGTALRAIELPVRRAGDYVLTVFAPDGELTIAVTIPVARGAES